MKNLKTLIILILSVGFLASCDAKDPESNKPNTMESYSLNGTVWGADKILQDGNTRYEYKSYIKFEFTEDKINISMQCIGLPPCVNHIHQGYVFYSYNQKTQIFKIKEDKMFITKISNQVKNPPTEDKISEQIFSLTLDNKDSIKDGFKITKDTNELTFVYKNFNRNSEYWDTFKLKKIK